MAVAIPCRRIPIEAIWDICLAEGCQGAQFGAGGDCLAHMSAQALGERLSLTEQPVDLDGRGVRFDRQSLERVLGAIPLRSGRRWLGTVRFDGAAFQHQAGFDETTFAGPASFVGADFSGDARFGGAKFESGASFDGVTFTQAGWFVEARFNGPVSFSGASFLGSAWFQRSVFSDADFEGALFSGNAIFTSATFSAVSSFAAVSFESHALFEKASFAVASNWEGVQFSSEGDGPPAAAGVPVLAKPVPAINGVGPATVGRVPLRQSTRLKRPRRRRNGISVLVPLLALALSLPMVYVLRPDGSTVPMATSDELLRTPYQVSTPTTALTSPSTPSAPTAATPLGRTDDYTFQNVDLFGRPGRFDPCQPIRYVVNPSGAPDNWREALTAALGEVNSATGMTFEDIGGTTNETVILNRAGPVSSESVRPPFQPERYSTNDWAPVLIAWAEPHLMNPGAVGSSLLESLETADGGIVHVTGAVVISTDIPSGFMKSVFMHEIAHLIGLGHATGQSQVMVPVETDAVPNSKWGAGDLTGLRMLGLQAGCLETPTPL